MTIVEEIKKLKEEKDAVILAHYYVRPEVQEIADYIGDSFYLSKVATKLKEQTIVFCGVSFMGESAKILNPEKTVLMPDMNADCPMAHMAEIETIKKVRSEYDDLAVVCYINSTAALKEYSDVCVTSANAVKIVKELPQKNIFFFDNRNRFFCNFYFCTYDTGEIVIFKTCVGQRSDYTVVQFVLKIKPRAIVHDHNLCCTIFFDDISDICFFTFTENKTGMITVLEIFHIYSSFL